MEILAGIASKLGELLVDATVKQARYLFCFNSIVKELEDKETNLKEVQDGINKKVEEERQIHRAIDIEKDVEKWLADVVKEMADVETLKTKIAEKKSCFNGWCPNWGFRYWMGRKASKETRKLSDLQDRGKFNTVALPKPLPADKEMPIPRFFSSFEATKSACKQITEALKKGSTKMVGLHGLGGVGKTTLAKFVGNQLRQEKIFDEVGIATVSQDPNIINVQSELVKSLGWKLKEKDEEERADRLRLMFSESKGRKILIILDDVWKELDLETVGIPANCCKILLTTRLQQVCDRMGCDTPIKLNALDQVEGLDLLRKHAGIDVADTTLIDVSKQVADECKGLPLAIKAVGSALRGRTVDEWKVALDKLQNAKLDKIEGIDRDSQGVYGCLKFSYDYLNGEDSRSCFLLCSLFPEDYEIDLEDLLGYAVGLVWYQAESIEKARSLLRGTIKGLKDSSLLLDTHDDGFVKMHDVVRDVALWIGKVEKKYFTSKIGIGLVERAVEEGLEQYRGISLVGNEKEELPSGLVCPNLHILRLENTEYDNKLQVLEHFFKEMPALKVVTIIGGVLSLKSLQFLANNLRVLQLIRCEVTDASFLGKLRTLQILYLEESRIEIPDGLGDELSRLKLLYIDTGSISPITINKFPQIEEFYGGVKDWEVEGMSSEESYARCAESDSQPDRSVVCLPKDFSFAKLQRYNINKADSYAIYRGTRNLYIENNHPKATLVIFSALYPELENLYLNRVRGYHNIVPSIDERGLNELTILHVTDCKDLECIMDASKSPHRKSGNPVMLSRLARLYMSELPELKWIWKAPAQHVISLQSLTELKVSQCNNLTYIFTLSLARSLVQLKSLKVSYCERLECVVEAKLDHNEREISAGDGNTILALPSLRKLRFKDLPELISFCSENYYSTWPALEELNLSNCPKLIVNSTELEANLQYLGEKLQILEVGKCFHLRDTIDALLKHDFKNLETLYIGELGVQVIFQVDYSKSPHGKSGNPLMLSRLAKLSMWGLPELKWIWKAPAQHVISLQSLTELSVSRCNNLTYIFTLSQARSLVQLKTLEVRECERLECIIEAKFDHNEGEISAVDGNTILELPLLRKLRFKDLPELISFCSENYYSTWPALEELNLSNCPKLIVNSTELEANLQYLGEKLQILEVGKCFHLRDTIDALLKHDFKNLETLYIGELGVQVIFQVDYSKSPHGKSGNPLMLSRLAKLSMWGLPELKWIWKAPAQHVISLQSLTELSVSRCNNLTYIFTLSQARSLVQLKTLEVRECERLECIIEAKFDHNEGEISAVDGNTILELPLLRKLRFKDLPELISFCSENYYSTWPALEELNLSNCPKLIVNSTELEANLQYLGEKLRILEVGKCFHLRDTIDALLKHDFKNLETLYIGELGVQVIFQVDYSKSPHGKSGNPLMLSRLAKLSMWGLPELKWIWKAPAQHVISLQSLTELKVSQCNNLTYIFTLSLARSLVQLKSLKVSYCERLECVVEAKLDHNEREISAGDGNTILALPSLRKLRFKDLPELISFCSENYYSTWPALEELNLSNCPKLIVNSTELEANLQYLGEKLRILEVGKCFHLRDTIDALLKHDFKNLETLYIGELGVQVIFQVDYSKSPHGKSGNPLMLSRLAKLSMWGLPELKWIWKAPAQHVISLQSLTELSVSRCNNLTYIFTLSQARSLVQLKTLEVRECERLECVVEAKLDHNEREISAGDGNTILALPSLRKLRFKDLPELISFCSENYYSTWPALEELNLSNCPKLIVNSTELEANLQYLGEKLRILKVSCFHLRDAMLKHGLKNLETLYIGELGVQVIFQVEVIIPCLRELYLHDIRELQVLLYHEGSTHNFSLQNLTRLSVDGCTMLRLFSSTLARNLLQLEVLSIWNCSELEQIIDEDEDEDHLQPVCFPKLKRISVGYCPKLKHLFHISVAPSLQKLEYIWITTNDELEEVFWHKDGADVTDYNEIVMNELQRLRLINLPNLTNFWPAGYQIPFPSASDENVRNCPKLRPSSEGDR